MNGPQLNNKGRVQVLSNLKKIISNSDKVFELFLLILMIAIGFIWLVEEQLDVIFDYDRYGYMVTLVVIPICFGLSFFARKTYIARVVIFIYLVAYLLLLTAITFLQAASSGNIYTIASTLQWVPAIYIVSFLFLPNKQAVWSAVAVYCLMLLLLIFAYLNVFEPQNNALKAMLLSAILSQGVCIFCLFGVVKLKRTRDAAGLRAEKMEKAANVDGLLGIGNRRMLQRELDTMASTHTPFSLLLIDVDHFKVINDTHGHLVGDDVLRELTLSIESNLRPGDTIGRWGGEEFLVLVNGTELIDAEMLAQRIRSGIDAHLFSTVGKVTVSIGVAQFQPNISVSQVFSIADKALYDAKNAGRNKVVVAAHSTI